MLCSIVSLSGWLMYNFLCKYFDFSVCFPSFQCYTDWRVCLASFQRVCGLPNSLGGYVFQSYCKSCQAYRFLLKNILSLFCSYRWSGWNHLICTCQCHPSFSFLPFHSVLCCDHSSIVSAIIQSTTCALCALYALACSCAHTAFYYLTNFYHESIPQNIQNRSCLQQLFE